MTFVMGNLSLSSMEIKNQKKLLLEVETIPGTKLVITMDPKDAVRFAGEMRQAAESLS